MGNSSIVGQLRALLSADTVDFVQNMGKGADAADKFQKNLTAAGQTFSDAGIRMGALKGAILDLSGAMDVRKAETWAEAIRQIGDASKLTAADQARVNQVMQEAIAHFQALGQEVPAHIQAIADQTKQISQSTDVVTTSLGELTKRVALGFGVEKLVEFGTKVVENASNVKRMAEAMDVSVETAQRFQFAAEVSGESVEQLAKSLNTLNKDLAEDTPETQRILEGLGLTLDELRQQNSEDRFRTVVKAIGDLNDPMLQAEAASKLLGRSLNETLTLIRSGALDAAQGISVMSAETVEKLHAAEVAWTKFRNALYVASGEQIAAIESIGEKWKYLVADLEHPIKFAIGVTTGNLAATAAGQLMAAEQAGQAPPAPAAPTTNLTPPIDANYLAQLEAARAEMASLTAEERKQIEAALALGTGTKVLAAEYGVSEEALTLFKKSLTEAQREAAAEAEQFDGLANKAATLKSAIDNLQASGASNSVITKQLGKDAAELVEKFDQAGLGSYQLGSGINKLASDYTMLKAESEKAGNVLNVGNVSAQVAAGFKAASASIDATRKLWDDYAVAVAKDSQDAYGAAILATNEWYQNEVDKLEASGVKGELYERKLEALAATRQERLTAAADAQVKREAQVLQQTSDLQSQYYDVLDAMAGNSAGVQIRQVQQWLADKIATMSAAQRADQDYYDGLERLADAKIEAIRVTMVTNTLEAAKSLSGILSGIGSGSFGAIAGGVGTGLGDAANLIKTVTQVQSAMSAEKVTLVAAIAAWSSLAGAMVEVGIQIYNAFKKADAETVLRNQFEEARNLGAEFSNVGAASTDLQGKIDSTYASLLQLTNTPVSGSTALDRLWLRLDAEALHLTDIINEMGGVKTGNNLIPIMDRFQRLFDLLKLGGAVAQQAMDQINQSFPLIVQGATDASGILDKSVVDMIKLDDQLGRQSSAIADYRNAQLTSAAQGIAAAVTITSDAYAAQTDLLKQKSDLEAKLANASAGDQADLQSQIDAVNQQLLVQQGIIDATAVHSQEAASALAGAVIGAVDAETASGKTFVQAILDQQSAIKNLQTDLQKTGYDGGAAFSFLNDELSLATDKVAGPALQAIEGITQGVVGLTNAGQMTQDQFAGLEGQIGATEAALEKQGFSHGTIMAAMQNDLQVAWELEQKYGFQVDDTTQALINEAVASGEVGEEHKSSTDQMLDATKEMATATKDMVKILSEAFGIQIPSEVEKTAKSVGGVRDQLEKMPKSVDVGINFDYSSSGNPSPWAPGPEAGSDRSGEQQQPEGPNPDNPTQSAANEGFFRAPQTITVGDDPWGEGEFVLWKRTVDNLAKGYGLPAQLANAMSANAGQWQEALSGIAMSSLPGPSVPSSVEDMATPGFGAQSLAAAAAAALAGAASASGDIRVQLNVDGRRFAEVVVDKQPGILRRRGQTLGR